ncbi:unnamed protein product [Arctogadus glacialis]
MRSLLDPADRDDTVPAPPAPLERDDRLDLDEWPDSEADDLAARDREGRPADLEDPDDLEDLEDPEERSALDEIPDTSERAVEEEEEEVEEEEVEEVETLLLDGISDTVDKAVVVSAIFILTLQLG